MENGSKWGGIIAALVVGLIVGYAVGAQKAKPPAVTKQTDYSTKQAMEQTVPEKTINIQFASHIQAKLPEQDVFLAGKDNNSQVVRIEGEAASDPANLARIVFATANATEHDPFKMGKNPLGPFAKGASLGITLQDWLAAGGSGTYTIKGNNADLALSLAKLVPNGVYTVWCSRLTFPPNPKVVDRPCGAADGSQNSFKADSSGNATFNLKLQPLEASTKETASVIAIAYHSDGKTYGASPGEFGKTTHVQIFFMVPVPVQ